MHSDFAPCSFANAHAPGADISGITIQGTDIATYGGYDIFRTTFRITGDFNVINAAGGLKISEKNDGAADWTYDNDYYILTYDPNQDQNCSLVKYHNGVADPNTDKELRFFNSYDNSDPNHPVDTELSVFLTKTVVQDGSVAPPRKYFYFDVAPVNNGVDISGLVFIGTSIYTSGAGTYGAGGNHAIHIYGDPDIITAAGGLRITEKNDGAAGWTYDQTVYVASLDAAGQPDLNKEDPVTGGLTPVREAAFTNTYDGTTQPTTTPTQPTPTQPTPQPSGSTATTPQSTSPDTGDAGTEALWMALSACSLVSLTIALTARKRLTAKQGK